MPATGPMTARAMSFSISTRSGRILSHRCDRHRQLHAAERLARRVTSWRAIPTARALPMISAAMRAAIEGGEGFDWYYAVQAGRDARERLPITDGLAGKHWVYRVKDLRGWWQNQHYDRIGGAEAATPSPWVPGRNPSGSPSLAARRSTRAPTSPTCFPIRNPRKAPFPGIRGRARRPGAACLSGGASGPLVRCGQCRRHGCGRPHSPVDLGRAAVPGLSALGLGSGRTGPTGAPVTGSTAGWGRWRSRI
jgi:hypothetical protein